jgi:hypothetical protein
VDGAYFNLSCTVVMEEGRQKSKRLPYMTKFKCEVTLCAEEKGNFKATAIFGVVESNDQQCRNTRHRSAGMRRHKGNSLDPRKDDFLKLVMQSSRFFKRDAKLGCLWVMLYLVRRR